MSRLKADSAELEAMFEDCEKRIEKLSEWELSFVDSLRVQVERTGGLSEKQEETFTQIWERITS